MSDNALATTRVDRGLADTIPIGKAGITFENAGQVMEYAKMMAASGSAVPKHLRGQPGACLGIIDDAIRFGFNPYALARKSYFVNDQLAYEAQVFAAIVNALAPLKERPDIKWEGEGPDRVCIVVGEFKVGGMRIYRSPRFADIEPKNSTLWKNDPDQQQSYYSLRAFARRWCPEVILGIFDSEELREQAMLDVTPSAQADPPAAASRPGSISETLDRFARSVEKMESPGVPPDTGDGGSDPVAAGVPTEPPARAPAAPSDKETAALRREAIDKLVALARNEDVPLEAREEDLDEALAWWLEKLPGAETFVRQCVDAAKNVARGEWKAADARKYLLALK
jgi:RecT family protein